MPVEMGRDLAVHFRINKGERFVFILLEVE